MTQRFQAKVWRYDGEAAWYFVTLPKDISQDIKELTGPRKGFGSVRVQVTIKDQVWRTSVFPDTKLEAYVLPIKKNVRAALGLDDGNETDVTLEILTNE